MSDEMRILTVRQPWAWAIIHGGKDVENRVRNIAGGYRGPVAIHAGREFDAAGLNSEPMHKRWLDLGGPYAPGNWGDRAAIIGVVELTDVHNATTSGQLPRCWGPGERIGDRGEGYCSPWALPAEKHLELANPRPLTAPIPYKGALGLRRLDKETIDTITAALVAETGEGS